MSTIKTIVSDESVEQFIDAIDDEQQRTDSTTLLRILSEQTGEKPRLWGSSIVGFGQYHYKSERSAQEGDWPLIGFSPRKQNLTIYIMNGFDSYGELLEQLGKHTLGKGCLYIKRLDDVDLKILRTLVKRSYVEMKAAQS